MVEIEEVVSDDYGFKLIGDISISDAVNLNQHAYGEELRLLAIHDKLRIIAASNSKSLKFISADNYEKFDDVEGSFSITQLYFTDSKFYILNDNGIQTLTLDQIKQKDYHFSSVEGRYSNLKPLDDQNYLAFDNGHLYHNSTEIASYVTKFAWHKSSPIYITESDQFQIMGKPIEYDEATKDELSDSHLVELKSIKDYIFLIYDTSEEQPSDDHQIRTFLLTYENEKYTPFDIEIASPYGAAYRTTTYYTASITNWLESTQLQFITSSLSLEIGILDVANSPPESILPSEDSNKANYPIDDETQLDVSPIGFAISMHEVNSKVDSPCVGVEGEVVGKLPKIYAFLDNGKLRSWWVFNKSGILKDRLSLERAISEKVSETTDKVDKAATDAKDSIKTETNAQSANTQPATPFQTANNPFGSSTAGAFRSSVSSSKTESAPESTKTAFGSTALGSTALGSTTFGAVQAPKSAFGSTGFDSVQASKTTFGSTGFGSSTFAASGFGSSGFGSSGFGSSSFGATPNNIANPEKLTLSSGFGKFSNQQPATFGNTTSGKNIFDNEEKTSSTFCQPSSTSSSFGKLESKSGSPFDLKQQQPLTQVKPMFGLASGSKPLPSPFSTLGKDTNTEGYDNTRQTPYANLMESSKESTPGPIGSTTEVEFKPSAQMADLSSLQNENSSFGQTGTDDLVSGFGGLGTNEKPSGTFGSGFAGSKRSDGASPFTLLQKPNASSPFANLGSTKTPTTGEKEHLQEDTENKSDAQPNSQTDVASNENKFDEDGNSGEAETVDKASGDDTKEETDSLDEFETTENYELSQDDEEDEVDDQKFVDESERNDSSWVNISKKDATGRILAQTLVNVKHEGAVEEVKETEIIEEEPGEESADEPIEPVDFLVFDGFCESLKKCDDPITNKIRTIIANTEGNLQFLEKNVAAVTKYIDTHSIPGKHWHRITEVDNLQFDKDMYKGKLRYLDDKEAEIEELNFKLQESQREYRKLGKSFSQLALLEKDSNKNLKFLKNRPLEPNKQEMRDKLKAKLASVQSLESKLRTMLIPIKAKSSINLSTVDKIEQILLQLNDQVLDRKLALTELEEQMERLDLSGKSKSLTLKPSAAKLNLRKRLREMNSKRISQ